MDLRVLRRQQQRAVLRQLPEPAPQALRPQASAAPAAPGCWGCLIGTARAPGDSCQRPPAVGSVHVECLHTAWHDDVGLASCRNVPGSLMDWDSGDGSQAPVDRVLRWWRGTTQAVGQFGTSIWEQVRPAVERVLADPAFLAAVEAPRVTPGERASACHCLCQAVHPDQPSICQVDAPVTSRRFVDVDVPLCAPCAAAA
jgi:hypothetical protein